MGAVEGVDRLVRDLLEPGADVLLAHDGVPVPVEVVHRLPDALAREDPAGLGPYLGDRPVEFLPGPGVRLGRVHPGTVGPAGRTQVALTPDGVRGAVRGGQVGVAQPVAECRHRGRGPVGGGVQFGPEPLRSTGHERGEPARAAVVLAGPGRELPDDGPGLAGRAQQPAGDALGQGRPVAVQRAGQVAQPPGDRRPVLVRVGGHQSEDAPHLVQGRVDVAQLAEVVTRLVQGQFSGQPFPQQPGAVPLDVLEHHAVLLGVPLDGVERGQCSPGQFGERLEALRRQVRLPAVPGRQAESGGDHGVEGGDLRDVVVGDPARGAQLLGHAAHADVPSPTVSATRRRLSAARARHGKPRCGRRRGRDVCSPVRSDAAGRTSGRAASQAAAGGMFWLAWKKLSGS